MLSTVKSDKEAQLADGKERIDKWLWSARFFKTRSLAAEALDRGRVEVNGERVKRARMIVPGDVVAIRRGPYTWTVVVRALQMTRRSASEAATMYEETDDSRRVREGVRVNIASLPIRPAGEGRPSKKERRQLRELRGRED
jgi:ribosome-associated heat shock protein Hsp15